METEFLSLAQALEGLHRATSPNKPGRARARSPQISGTRTQRETFATRLNELCTRLSSSLLEKMKIVPHDFVKAPKVLHTFGRQHYPAAIEHARFVLAVPKNACAAPGHYVAAHWNTRRTDL